MGKFSIELNGIANIKALLEGREVADNMLLQAIIAHSNAHTALSGEEEGGV